MTGKCVSGKKMFASQQIAEDVLIELWSKNEYVERHAPVSVYKCEDCGYFHLTSRSPMSESLSSALKSGKIKLNREANKWLDRFK